MADIEQLIIVPQMPVKMRYQQWWFYELPLQYERLFDGQVSVLGLPKEWAKEVLPDQISTPKDAVSFEAHQADQYMGMDVQNAIVLLCDLSFPGLFAHALLHNRPARAYVICHATSANLYDLFASVRRIKYPIERSLAKLFEAVFVASEYHAQKLRWPNTKVVSLPYPPHSLGASWIAQLDKYYPVVVAARPGVQKRNMKLERLAERVIGRKIVQAARDSWTHYYESLACAQYLLVTAREETFGYQIVDAVLSGTAPLAPRGLSYPELLPDEYLYGSKEELADKLRGPQLEVPRLLVDEQMRDFYKNTMREMLTCP